jgi:hypothetical protein
MTADVDLLPIYQAMKARLKTVDPARSFQAYDYVPGVNEWPGALILPPTIEPQGADDGWLILRFEIVVLVSAAVDENQLKLFEYQSSDGPKSIPKAFASEPTLGGLVGQVRVERSRPLSYEEQAGYLGFGCIFETVAWVG